MADRSLVLRIRADLAQAKASVQGFASDLKGVGDAAAKQASSGLRNLAKSARDNRAEWEQLGRGLAGFGAAGVAAFGASAKAAIDWESAFAGVKKTVDDSAEGYANLSSELRGMARELPATHSEIAGVAEAAGQLGIARENITGFTRTMIDLGEATNLSADEAATALARFANIMGTSQTEFSNIGSAVVDLGNNFATTEREIVEMGLRLAGAGRQARLTEGEVLGLATALSSVGIEADAGGTAFSRVIIEMGKAVDTGSDKLGTFAKVAGMTTEEFARAWEENAGGAIAAFVGGLGDLESSGQSIQPILEDLGMTDVRVGDALRRASSAADLFTGAMDMGNEAYAENIALTKEAEQRYGTVESQLAMMRNSITDAAISFGEVLLPAIAGVAGAVADFADWMADLPGPVKAGITVVGTLGSTVALAAGGFMLIVPRVVETVEAMRKLGLQIPNAERVLRKFGKTAGVAAGVLGGVGLIWALSEAGHAMHDFSMTTEEAEQRLLKFKDTATLSALFEGNIHAVENFDAALAEITDDSAWAGFGRSLNDVGDGLGKLFGQDTRSSFRKARDDLAKVDEVLGGMARENLPQAQELFAKLAAQTDGSDESLNNLLKTMPQYAAALQGIATEQGITLEGTMLLKAAMGDLSLEASGMGSMFTEVLTGALKGHLSPALEEHVEITKEAIDAWNEYLQGFGDGAQEFANLGSALDAYNAEVQELAQAEADAFNATITGTDQAAKSWEDFVNDSIFDLDRYKAHLESLVESQANWSGNMIYLAGRIPPAMLEELANLGPEAAPMIQALADATDAELQEIVALWEEAGKDMPRQLTRGIELNQGLANAVTERLGAGMVDHVLSQVESGELTLQEAIDRWDLRAVLEASTDPAMQALLAYVEEVEDTTATATVNADTGAALGEVTKWEIYTENRRPVPKVDADPKPAGKKVDGWEGETIRRRPVVKVDANTNPAERKMQSFYDHWSGRTFKVNIAAAVTSSVGLDVGFGLKGNRADGGIDHAGNFVPRVSQFGGPQFGRQNIVWGEPETGWEAYISGKPSQRNRNIGIWEQAGRMLGISFNRYANGGVNMPWRMNVGADKNLLQDMFDHVASASKSWSERLRVTRATGDWRSLWNMVSPFGVSLFSAYRPGARTATGFQSKHALGKAIDVSPSRTLWNFLEPMKHAFAELYGPWGLWLRGENRWKYPGAAITARNHRDHIHIAAYANGGIKAADTGRLSLNPGWNAIYNGLNRTEHMQETLGRQNAAWQAGPTFNITNVYPQAEPTSKTVQRASQHQAAAGRY